MKKVIEILLILSIIGLVSGRLLMQYGICNYSFFVVGFVAYVISFFAIFLFSLVLFVPEEKTN
ncbi:MAG: hypothetical protein A2Y67_01465 [Candidatus Buchananbacteria bacterium RBG_13_39_9]|uniref:Uncharacterized protein n=1 Tax=Candidatus Buchananbacteria bacterium RBG_13_39_9 TaxID=1797531 RepID=A0A1G1XRL4_9BACT|nr:MAG: hypothetical protein A2Y67_01465 [Candidatus Buchananbacteria bacterium RBG_13_39_9]